MYKPTNKSSEMKIVLSEKQDHEVLSEITYQGRAFWGYEKE